jgi:hypothetical protein
LKDLLVAIRLPPLAEPPESPTHPGVNNYKSTALNELIQLKAEKNIGLHNEYGAIVRSNAKGADDVYNPNNQRVGWNGARCRSSFDGCPCSPGF